MGGLQRDLNMAKVRSGALDTNYKKVQKEQQVVQLQLGQSQAECTRLANEDERLRATIKEAEKNAERATFDVCITIADLKKDVQRATRKLDMELHRTKTLRELVENNRKLYYQERQKVSALLQVHIFSRPHMLCLIMLISSLCLTSPHQAKKGANTKHKKEINIMTQTMCAREEHVEEMQSTYGEKIYEVTG